MGKRPRDQNGTRPRSNRRKPSAATVLKPDIIADSPYTPLEPPADEIVLLNSDDESDPDIVVESENDENDSNSDEEEDAPAPQKASLAVDSEVTRNSDFISLGFSSLEEDDNNDGLDDGLLSDDATHSRHHSAEPTSDFPWVKGHDHLKQKEIADWLTHEIKDFISYISPSSEEIVQRNKVISGLKASISAFWPDAIAHVFGLSATDLYLPGSDIDMVVVLSSGDKEQRWRLYQLSSYLRKEGLAKNIEVIATAKVPIIKFVDPKAGIHVDISFERSNGLDAARRIRRWLDLTPGLRELVLVVKQFLRSRRLNNVHVGGLGGYSTIIMVYHFLKLHPRVSTCNIDVRENLGSLLIEFFELYGRNFSYDNLVIALGPDGETPRYIPKQRCPVLTQGRGQFTIIIQDPLDFSNNITRSSYNLRDLKKAFVGAYQLLVDRCYQLNGASYKLRLGQLILGDIIRFRGKERNFEDDRDKVVNLALINHHSDDDYGNDDDESDGAGGNDKYYISDMTALSEEADPEPPKKVRKVAPAENVEREDKLTARDFLSIESDSGEDSDNETQQGKQASGANLDKDVKRDFWKLKGLET